MKESDHDIYSEVFDAAVIGSGPAGSTAAYFLSLNGLRVIVFEKDNLPRYKVCGGGLVKKARDLLPFDLDGSVETECYSVKINDDFARRSFIVERSHPIIYMTMRENLDSKILFEAEKLGTLIKPNTKVNDVDVMPNHVEVKTGNGKVKAKFVVYADGVMGVGSKKNNVSDSQKAPAIEAEVYVDEQTFNRFSKSARFDFGIPPGGYAWLFPKKDHLSIGVISMKKTGVSLHSAFNNYLEKLQLNRIDKIAKHGYFIPLIKRTKEYAWGRELFTGDSIGLADPVTAEGISTAILSGKLAAEAIIKGKQIPSLVSSFYNFSINHEIQDDIRYARIISKLVYQFRFMHTILFKLYGQRLSELMADIISGKNNYRKLLTDPKNYFKLILRLFSK